MRADRLLKMMILLQTRGKMTAIQLADELEVSRRTILRDINALSFSGVPIYADGGHGGGISLDENYRIKLNGLKEVEVQALILSSNAALLSDIGLEDAAEQSLMKLLTALPSLYEHSIKQFQNYIYIDPVAWWHKEQPLTYLETIQDAVYANRVIQIAYQKHDGTRLIRTIQPYGLVAKASVWYCVAAHDNQFRNYRISRISEVKLLNETFIRDSEFNLAKYWQTSTRNFLDSVSFFEFTLEIHPDKKDFVTWYSPGFCQVSPMTNSDWYSGHFYVDSLELATMFVIGLGNEIKIVEPDELKEAVEEKMRTLINQYQN